MRAALVAAGLALAPLAACSGDDAEARYCEVAEEQGAVLRELSQSASPGTDVLTPSVEAVRELRAAAPPELADEWVTVLNAYEGLADAVAAAGVPPEEYRQGELPPEVRGEARRAIEGAATNLGSLPVLEAAGAVEDHAREVCDVDLGG